MNARDPALPTAEFFSICVHRRRHGHLARSTVSPSTTERARWYWSGLPPCSTNEQRGKGCSTPPSAGTVDCCGVLDFLEGKQHLCYLLIRIRGVVANTTSRRAVHTSTPRLGAFGAAVERMQRCCKEGTTYHLHWKSKVTSQEPDPESNESPPF